VDKARRPYLEDDRSYVEMMKAPARFLKESNLKESVFEKPYLDEAANYRRMHFNLPAPDWPSWDREYRGLSIPWRHSSLSSCCKKEDKGNCVLRADDWFFDEDDCSGEIFVWLSHYYSECDGCDGKWFMAKASKGTKIYLWLGPPRPGGIVDFSYADTEKVWALIGYEDYRGHQCVVQIQGECGKTECTDVEELTWDWDNSPDTIATGETKTVYVLGGHPPFTWYIAGQDFSLGARRTTGRSNTVTAGDDSCGPCSIDVVDACDNMCTGSLRNTSSGRWSLDPQTETCGLPGLLGTYLGESGGGWEYEAIQGKYKQTDIIYSPGGCSCTEESCPCETWCDGYGYCLDGDLGCDVCLDPNDSTRTPPGYLGTNDEGDPWWYAMCNRALDLRVWECP